MVTTWLLSPLTNKQIYLIPHRHFANWRKNTKNFGLTKARLEITRRFLPRLIKMTSYHSMSITIRHGAMQCIFMATVSGLCRTTRRSPFPQASATHGLCNRKSVSALFSRPTTLVYGCFIVMCWNMPHQAWAQFYQSPSPTPIIVFISRGFRQWRFIRQR